MRRIGAGLFVSLDGVYENPQQWNLPYSDGEMAEAIGATMASADAFLLGRVTYEEWAGFWPAQPADQNPMAGFINSAKKYVVSRSLTSTNWQNSELLPGGIDDVRDLKAQPGNDIVVSGSGTLVRSLLDARLIDELQLMVHPVVVAEGRKLLDPIREPQTLTLEEAKPLSSGVVVLKYGTAAA